MFPSLHPSPFMNFYLLATSAWGVRKGNYARKRFTAMVNHFETCFYRSYKNILRSDKISRKRKKSVYSAYKLYRHGIELFQGYEDNCLMLLEGLMYIDKGREKFLKRGKHIFKVLDKKIQ